MRQRVGHDAQTAPKQEGDAAYAEGANMWMELLSWLVNKLESEPTTAAIKRADENIAKLLRGYFRDATSQLRDAAAADSENEKRRLAQLATESFRSAHSRTESPLAAAYVASCYTTLRQNKLASQWFDFARRDVARKHAALFAELDESSVARDAIRVVLHLSIVGGLFADIHSGIHRRRIESKLDLLVDTERASRILENLASEDANLATSDDLEVVYCFPPELYAWGWDYRVTRKGLRCWLDVGVIDVNLQGLPIVHKLRQFRQDDPGGTIDRDMQNLIYNLHAQGN